MADNFDPYHVWLGISRAEQPAHHYRLLGIDAFESDLDVIEGAADRQMSHVQKHKIGAHSADSQKLLNQLAAARVTLLNPAKKADYDQKLRARLAAQAAQAASAEVKVQAATAPVSAGAVNPAAEIFQAVAYQPVPADERTAPRKGRKPVKKSKIHPAVFAIPIVVVLGGVGGWLALRNTATPPAVQAKAQAHHPDKKSAGKASKREAVVPADTDPVETPSKAIAAREPSTGFQPAKDPPVATAADQADSSEWLDMLSLIGKSQTISGNWNLQEPGSLRCVSPPEMYSRLMLPVIPPREYEIEADVLRNASETDFGLASGSRHFVLVVNGWENRATTGFQLIDGKPGNNQSLGAHVGEVIPLQGSGHLKIVVRTTGVTLDLNGNRILTWSQGLDRLGADESLSTPDPRRLFVAGRGEPFRFNKLRLRSLSGEPPIVLGSAGNVNVTIGPNNTATGTLPGGQSLPAGNSTFSGKPSVPLVVLQASPNPTYGASISPDGRLVSCSKQNGSNPVWDVQKGSALGGIQGQGKINKSAFTANSRQLVLVSSSSYYLWDVSTSQILRTGSWPEGNKPDRTAVSQDARVVACHDLATQTVSVFEVSSGEMLYQGNNVRGRPTSLALSPDGKLVFVAGKIRVGNNSSVYNKIYDVPAKRELTFNLNLADAAYAAVFSTDATRIAFSNSIQSSEIVVWNLAKDELASTIRLPQPITVTNLAFTPDGRKLLSGGSEPEVRLWDVATAQLLAEFPGHEKSVTGLQVAADGATAVTADFVGNVRLWSLAEPGGPVPKIAIASFVGQVPEVAQTQLNPSSGVALLANPGANRPPENPAVVKKPAIPFKVLQDQGEHVNCAALSPDGHWVMWATNRGTNNLWDLRKGKLAGALDSRQQPIIKAAFTPDSRRLITANYRTVLVWDMQTGQLARTVSLPETGQAVVSVAPDGRMVGSLESNANAVSILDPLNGEVLYRPEVNASSCIGFSPGGKLAFMSGYSQVAGNNGTSFNKLFDVPAKREVPCGLNISGTVFAVAFSADASRMAVTDPYFSIKIWDVVKNQLLTTIRPGNTDGLMIRLAFTPDGRKLLCGGANSTASLWNAETGKRLLDFPGHDNAVTDLQITADGRIGLTADGAGAVRLWRLEEAGSLMAPPSAAATTEPPDLAKQQAAAALIKDVYADDFSKAKKPAEKLALADKLLNLSRTSQDLSEKYVLIVKARDLAREAGEPLVFLQAVQSLGATFKVDMYEMTLTGVEGMAKENLAPRARQDLAEGLLPLAARAVEQDKFEEARKLLLAAQASARKSNDTASLKTIVARLAEIGDARKQAEEIKAAEEAVAKKPDDPAANLALGKIYCLTKDDWSAGLPLLAKSSDESFKALAAQEIAQPRQAAEQTKLADGWYALSDGLTGKAKSRLLQHAAAWYRRAEPSLSGLMQVKVTKRLEEITARVSTDAGEPVAGAEKPAANNPVSSTTPLATRIKTAIKKETYVNSRMMGSTDSGKKFFELTPNGGILVGFNYTLDDNNNGQMSSMQAIYQVGRNVAPGAVWGQPRGTPGTIVAKKGYAVGGVKASSQFSITGFEVTFMKIDRNMLDSKDKYASPWIGSTVNQGLTKSVDSDGQPIIGILGYAEYFMYGFGLVQLPGQ